MWKKIKIFYGEVKAEMLKVSWPSKDEIIGSTFVVISIVIILAAFTGVADAIINGIFEKIILRK
jgi:preprotein translocase subunit SecE